MNNWTVLIAAEKKARADAGVEIARRIREAAVNSEANAVGAEIIALQYARENGADV